MRSLFFVLAALLVVPGAVLAKGQDMRQPSVYYVPANEVVSGNVYRAGELVQIDGTVEGDLIVAAETVKINGTVTGDVIAAAGRVVIAGPVLGDVRVAAGEVDVDGVIGKNFNAAAGTVRFSKQSAVGYEALVFAGELDMDGLIKSDLRGAVGSAVLSGSVNHDVWLKAERIILQPTSVIGGNLSYASPVAAQVMSGALVKGEVNFEAFEPQQQEVGAAAGIALGLFLFFVVMKWLGFWLLALCIIWLLPKKLEKSMRELDHGVWPALGIGLLTLIGVPVASLIIALTVAGAPIAMALFTLYVLAVMFGKIIVSTYVGEWIIRQFTNRHWRGVSLVWSSLLGITLLYIVTLIPFIGWMVSALALSLGVGALLQFERHELRRWR